MSSERLHPLVQFLQTRGRFLVITALTAAFGIALTYRFASSHQHRRINDFFQAEHELEQLTRSETEAAGAAFGRLQGILERHAELHQKYDGLIAQSLIKQEKVDLGEQFAGQVFSRVPASIAPYADFAATTLMIGKKEYATALQQARQLQDSIKSVTHGEALYLHNLLRIAFLCEETGSSDEQRVAWLEVLHAFEAPANDQDPLNEQSRQETLASFKKGQVSVLDYAKAKLFALSNA